jgi:hypothetical protein
MPLSASGIQHSDHQTKDTVRWRVRLPPRKTMIGTASYTEYKT